MSLSVTGSNTNNPYINLQALLQQQNSANGSTAQSDPLSALLAALGQGGSGGTSSPAGSSSTTSGTTTTSGSSSPQFDPQTLQALLALQDNGSTPQSPASGDTSTDADPNSGQQTGQAQGAHGHHHHHGGGGGGAQGLLDALNSTDSGASTQSTSNVNGSSTTTITYADGSTVSMTTAAGSGSSDSSSGSSTAGASNVASNNLLEQLIQMQAQLMNTATPQNVATV